MTVIYNTHSMKRRRQGLRNSAPRAEIVLWRYLKGKQLAGCKFRRQYSVSGYVIDFYCARLRLGIEVDGPSHFLSKQTIVYDNQRQKFIESLGIRIIRITNRDVYHNITGVIELLLRLAR
ncbi:MAG: endonuclease domain-containing protein [Patescibacteria group bacterium]|nr:endonuclease domain-containing protein [Patescibacteria group bacterium]MDD5715249.1 endonuclease domain-containing protein [Patescibacteria group bacterium]